MTDMIEIVDKLCLMIFLKDLSIELSQSDIDQLRNSVETIERYMNIYEEGSDRNETL